MEVWRGGAWCSGATGAVQRGVEGSAERRGESRRGAESCVERYGYGEARRAAAACGECDREGGECDGVQCAQTSSGGGIDEG